MESQKIPITYKYSDSCKICSLIYKILYYLQTSRIALLRMERRVIDSHVHWFDLENNPSWYQTWPPKDDTNLRKTFLPDDYFEQTANMILAGIHVQVPHEMEENFWIKKLA